MKDDVNRDANLEKQADYTTQHPSEEQTVTQTVLELQALSSRINALNEFSTVINRSLDIDEIFHLASQQAKWLIDYDVCYVSLQNGDGPRRYAFCLEGIADEMQIETLAQQEIVAQALRSHQPQLVQGDQANGLHYPSQIVIPLESGNEVLGVIHFESQRSRHYSQEDLRIAVLLATQLAGAIRNAQRFSEINGLYAQLEEAFAGLKRVKEMQADLTSMIVHDLRSPLSTIMMAVQLLEHHLKPLDAPDAIGRATRLANSSAQRMMGMIQELLDICKLEAGELQPQLATIDTQTLIQELCRHYRLRADSTQKHFVTHIPDQLPMIRGDMSLLSRVFDNLVDNAFKYASTHGQVTLSVEQGESYLEIAVEDDGPGIPFELRQEVFRKFFQVSDTSHNKQRTKGIGLGLTFCRLAIEAHGGQIWVESGKDVGNRFVFSLPHQHFKESKKR